jgi:hypothetical protein
MKMRVKINKNKNFQKKGKTRKAIENKQTNDFNHVTAKYNVTEDTPIYKKE